MQRCGDRSPVERGDFAVKKTRLSLYYLGSYLFIIGLGLLLAPHATLTILLSNGDYGDVFPRMAGMLMSGMGLSIFGMIRANASELYPATLLIRVYFIVCIVAFYAMTHGSAVPGPPCHCRARVRADPERLSP